MEKRRPLTIDLLAVAGILTVLLFGYKDFSLASFKQGRSLLVGTWTISPRSSDLRVQELNFVSSLKFWMIGSG